MEKVYINDVRQSKYFLKRFIKPIIIAGLCIFIIFALYSIIGRSIINVDLEKAQYVNDLIQAKMGQDKPPLIDYSPYKWDNDPTQNCKDWSFAFVVLYGHPAAVYVNDTHAFVRIRRFIIEPEQTAVKFDPYYRKTSANYSPNRRVFIRKQDYQAITDYFY